MLYTTGTFVNPYEYDSRSRADFSSRVKICESEASESQYWLEIIAEIGWISQEHIKPLYQECSDLLAIFSSIGRGRRSD
ncbi:MAG: four helix bundle protein [Desulfohalobiaceae bacterium]|nr:four helix bundle protein [Desulfohalobiaceae bacterium]